MSTAGSTPRIVVPLVAAVSLVVGFAVAQGTGLRWLGAIILLAGGGYCAVLMFKAVGVWRVLVLAVVYVASFVVSHPLGTLVGSWVSVVLVALATFAVGYALMRPTGSRSSTTSPAIDSTR